MSRVHQAEGSREAGRRGNSDAHSRYQFPSRHDRRRARKAARRAGRRICQAYRS